MAKENYMIGLTDAQKRATMCLDDIQDVCIKHKLNLTILDDGIGFVDPKDNKIVMDMETEVQTRNAIVTSYGGKHISRFQTSHTETVLRKYVRFHIWRFKGKWQIYGKQKETYSQRNETEVG